MRRVLPGGATPGGTNHESDERRVACRPLATVVERTRQRKAAVQPATGVETPLGPVQKTDRPKAPTLMERLSSIKLMLELLAVIVGLIGAIVALFARLSK